MENHASLIDQLIGVAHWLEEQCNLEEGLREVASLTAQIFKTQRCSIMLLCEEDNPETEVFEWRVFTYDKSPIAADQQGVSQLKHDIAGYVATTGKPVLIKDIAQSPLMPVASYLREMQQSWIAVPILLGERVIGVINLSEPLDRDCFNEEDLGWLQLFARLVGKSLHIAQLQTILRSKFVEIAVVNDCQERQVSDAIAMTPNPTKLAKIVAKSFFRELTKAGFSPNQVIEIATEVLNLLQSSLDKLKKRIIRDD